MPNYFVADGVVVFTSSASAPSVTNRPQRSEFLCEHAAPHEPRRVLRARKNQTLIDSRVAPESGPGQGGPEPTRCSELAPLPFFMRDGSGERRVASVRRGPSLDLRANVV